MKGAAESPQGGSLLDAPDPGADHELRQGLTAVAEEHPFATEVTMFLKCVVQSTGHRDLAAASALRDRFELVEVVEGCSLWTTFSSLMVHVISSTTSHSAAFLSMTLRTVSTLLTVFGDFVHSADFRRCTSVEGSTRLESAFVR
jgi:hypothetical protein